MKSIIYFILILTLVFSCHKNQEKTPEIDIKNSDKIQLSSLQIKNIGIEIGGFQNENLANESLLYGKTETTPESMAKVSALMGGIIQKSHWIPGMKVQKGQTLAIIQDQSIIQLQHDYLLAISNSKWAKNDFSRQKNLHEDLASSTKSLQKSQNDYEIQQINQSVLVEKLKLIGISPQSISTKNIRTTIHVIAPISGYISKVNVSKGQFVNASEVLFEIQNTNSLHLVLKVYEKDLSKIFEKQALQAFSNHNPNKKYPAKIHLISKNFDSERRVSVHCDFDVPTPDLYSEMFMNARIEGVLQDSKSLPEDAVVSFEGQTYVFVAMPNNQFMMKPISIGITQNKRTQIKTDDAQLLNQKIVTKGAYYLLMALKNIEE